MHQNLPPNQRPNNIPKGRLGEHLAIQFLRKKGYKIIDQNFYKRGGELDIIATKSNTTVFVEVKTRWSKQFGLPEESVTPRKMRLLIRTIDYYMLLHKELPESLRLDVIAVELDSTGKLLDIRHTENITG